MSTELVAGTDMKRVNTLRVGVVGESFTIPETDKIDFDFFEVIATVAGLFAVAVNEIRQDYPGRYPILVMRESDDGVATVVRGVAAKHNLAVCSLVQRESLSAALRNPLPTIEHLATDNPTLAFLRLCQVVVRIGGNSGVRALVSRFEKLRGKGSVYEYDPL